MLERSKDTQPDASDGHNGYVIDTKGIVDDGSDTQLRTASDGHTVLIPQPTDDPNDPLNWSSRKKHTILFVISVLAALPDFGSSLGAVTLIPQAVYARLHGRSFAMRLTSR